MIQSATLAKIDLAALMKSARPEPPAVPGDWRGGLFKGLTGADKPWGSTEDAVTLLRGGKIAEGRELLRRLSKHSQDSVAVAVYARELARPPEDEAQSQMYVNRLPAGSGECNSLKAMDAATGRDYGTAEECFMNAAGARPVSEYGCAMFLQALLYCSDLYFQSKLLVPRKRECEGVIVSTPMKGAAQLSLRRHEEAWETFRLGWIQSEEKADRYMQTLKVTPTAEERKFMASQMSDMCVIGMGVVLWDLGLGVQAAGVFAVFAKTLEGNTGYCAQVLAGEKPA